MKDMTVGGPGRVLFRFALSLMLGNLFQQLYTFVDTIIVGRYLGDGALAALGAVEWLTFIMFSCASGITHGFSVSIAQKFGCRAGHIGNCLTMLVLLSVPAQKRTASFKWGKSVLG